MGCTSVALAIDCAPEFAAACGFFADDECAALLFACAPLLFTPADVLPTPEAPAWLVLCCAEAPAEELFPACTPFDRLASTDVLLAADAPACVPGCDCA